MNVIQGALWSAILKKIPGNPPGWQLPPECDRSYSIKQGGSEAVDIGEENHIPLRCAYSSNSETVSLRASPRLSLATIFPSLSTIKLEGMEFTAYKRAAALFQ